MTDRPEYLQNDFLLYDGECPACRSYIAIAQLRKLWPRLQILDARSEPTLVARLRADGCEINDGMVLCLRGTVHFGAEATRMIGAAGRVHGGARRWTLAAIGSAPWSRRLYPWLNRGRQLLLRGLGRALIG